MNIGKVVLVATAVAALTPMSVAPAIAQVPPPFVITVDEQGHMIVNGNLFLGALRLDPLSQLVGLYYQLPFPGVAGDIELIDPNTPGELRYSDVLRFDGNGGFFFFSDEFADADFNPAEPPDLADVPQMPIVFPGLFRWFIEQSVDGSAGLFNYQPSLNDPGGDPSNPTYNFISDTPEPVTVVLLGTGLLGIGGVVRRRRRTA